MKVLIVDDNEDCIHLLRQVLHFLPSAEITDASSACEAWWYLTDPAKPFDLLICDVSMPSVSGLDLTQRIRATPSLKHLRIILCSGVNNRKTVEAFHQLGIAHYVVKPFALATMLDKITAAMGPVL